MRIMILNVADFNCTLHTESILIWGLSSSMLFKWANLLCFYSLSTESRRFVIKRAVVLNELRVGRDEKRGEV